MTDIRPYRVILPVGDIEHAANFYGAILGIDGQRVSTGRHYFRFDHLIVACYDPVADGDGGSHGWRLHPNQYLYFAVTDLESCYARVRRAGGPPPTAPQVMPWGERLFYVDDPWDNHLAFVDDATLYLGDTSPLADA